MSSSSTIPTQAPPDLKSLTPFLQRANELAKADPVMSYWCLYYAAQLGINAKPKERDSTTLLVSLLDQLEELKQSLSENDAATSNEAGSAYIENFALKVFVGADNEDRGGKADRNTARKFLAASNFLELLDIFGGASDDVIEKRKYAKWKAAEISKAIKEGRKPAPGPPGWDPEEDKRQREAEREAEQEAQRAIAEAKDDDDLLARELAKLTGEVPSGLPQQSSAVRGEEEVAGPSSTTPPTTSADEAHFAHAISPPPGANSPARTSDRRARARLSFDAGALLSGDLPPTDDPSLQPTSSTSNQPPPSVTEPSTTPPGLGPNGSGGVISPPVGGLASPNFSHPLRPQLEKRSTAGSATSSHGSGGNQGWETSPASQTQSPFLNLPNSGPGTGPQSPSRAIPTSPAPGEVTIPGRPLPVPPASGFAPPNQQMNLPSAPPAGAAGIGVALPTPSAPPQAMSAGGPHQPTTAASTGPSAPPPPQALPTSLTPSQTAKAQKLAKFAVSALDYDDIETASRQLREALAVVEGRDG